MAQVNITSSKTPQELAQEAAIRTKSGVVQQVRSDFNLVAPELVADYLALDATQRNQARQILINWSTSTQAQKVEATHGAQGLAFAVIDFLIDKIIDLENRVKALESK